MLYNSDLRHGPEFDFNQDALVDRGSKLLIYFNAFETVSNLLIYFSSTLKQHL